MSEQPLHARDTVTELPAPPNPEELVARYFGPPTPTLHAEFGALSHTGKVRASNEDHFAVVRRRRSRDVVLTNLPEDALHPSAEEAYSMVVADGVGGNTFGEVASMLALQAGWDSASRAFK